MYMKKAFFTICSKNFLAHARVLYKSIAAHYPDTPFYAVLCDRFDCAVDPEEEPFPFIHLRDLDIPGLREMTSYYNITELNTSIKPFAFLYLFEKLDFDVVTYLDPDILVLARLEELDAHLESGAQAVLTPHLLEPSGTDDVTDRFILLVGTFNLGFLSLRKTPDTLKFLGWWAVRLKKECLIKMDEGIFVDQKWCDLLPSFVPELRILRHPGYNAAYWNAHQRPITKSGDGWLASGEPLKFFHFSGYQHDNDELLSRHRPALKLAELGDLAALVKLYRERLNGEAHLRYRNMPYAFSWNGHSGINLHTPKPDAGAAQETTNASDVPRLSITKRNLPGILWTHRWAVVRYAAHKLGQTPLLMKKVRHAWRDGGYRLVWNRTKSLLKHHLTMAVQSNGRCFSVATPTGDEGSSAFSNRQPNLLCIDVAIPQPDKDTGSASTFTLLRIYSELGFNVTFIPSDLQYREGYAENLESVGITVLFGSRISSIHDYLAANGQKYNYVLLNRGPVVINYLTDIKTYAPQTKTIFNTVDLHSLRVLRQGELENSGELQEYASQLEEMERKLFAECDISLLWSEYELHYVQKKHWPGNPYLLPLLFADSQPSFTPFDERKDILFIGGFQHLPNVDSVVYFTERIFPLIREVLPGIGFHIVGSHPPDTVLALGKKPGVTVHGYVPDLSPVFSKIRLSVTPLRYGAGIKGKIVTSLSYGVPVIATSVAAEGMGISEDGGVVVADGETLFAQATICAYTDREFWTRLHEAALRTNNAQFSPERGKMRIVELMRALDPESRILEYYPIKSFEHYQNYSSLVAEETKKRHQFELELAQPDRSFVLPGFCAVCGKESNFISSWMYSLTAEDGSPLMNWREHLQCQECGLVTRVRGALHFFYTRFHPDKGASIYLTEQLTPLYAHLSRKHPHLVGSEFLGSDTVPGTVRDNVRHEDVTNLSFPRNSFDFILSFDVLEHVADWKKALSEFARTLKPGGKLLFTAPFNKYSDQTLIRAEVSPTGEILHHLPPEYHGNPVDPENGSLCFQTFGWQLMDDLKDAGFENPTAHIYWSKDYMYLGGEQFIFTAEKPFFD